MRLGQTVPVYENMENLTGLIGYGKLIGCTGRYKTFQLWVVQFKDEREIQFVFWNRNFKKVQKR